MIVINHFNIKIPSATHAHQVPLGFFDGAQVIFCTQPSVARGGYTLSAAHNPRGAHPSFSANANPHAVLGRLSSFFHPSHTSADGPTKFQQHPWRSIFTRSPRIIEVPTVQDRKVFFLLVHFPSLVQ
ncbi:hypothetical protein BDR07DRAFT_719406 [Suillus spraguei]|nr:hypothetical protein BDR07DRAFT_719406 [Suillus spraguei]